MMLKLGQKVIVRKDLNDDYCIYGVNSYMTRLRGKEVTIKEIVRGTSEIIYKVLEDTANNNWSIECFLPVKFSLKELVGDYDEV